MAKAKPDRIDALNQIMLTTEGGLSMKQIMYKAKRKTGKVVSERFIRKYLNDLKDNGDLRVVTIRKDGEETYEVLVGRPPDQVLTPQGIVPAVSLPTFRPIKFGRPISNVPEPTGPQPLAKQVAGARSALAFVESLQQ